MRNNLVRTVFLISILLFPAECISPQNGTVFSQYIFNSISIDEGLPSNFVDDIIKDSKGFIWISTQGGGLSRYDGYEFVTLNVSSSPVSLKSNFIRKSLEDNFKRLWVISNNGVDIIDLLTIEESHLSHLNSLSEILLKTSFNTVFKDSRGALWFLSNTQIFKIEFNNKGEVEKISRTADDSSPQHYFTTISEINNEIWVGDNGSLYKIITNQGNELLPLAIPNVPDIGSGLYISAILKKENYIWIGTENGLFRYNIADKSMKHYTYSTTGESSISQDIITDLCLTNEGVLIIGTLKGMNAYNPQADSFERISHHINDRTLNNDFVNCFLPDGNSIWIGTEAGGVNKMTGKKLAVHNYSHTATDRRSLPPNPVNAIYEDRKRNLWVGTVEGGLSLKDKSGNGFAHYTMDGGYLTHNSVSAIEEDNNGNLWTGTWGGGVSVLDISKIPAITYRHLTHPGLNYIGILKYDPVNDGMWICTNRNVFYYDFESRSIKNPLPGNVTQNIAGTLGCIIDNQNRLWIGCSEGLIVVDIEQFDRRNYTCEASFLKLDNEEVDTWVLKNITCIYEGKDNSVWLGSNGYGMCRLTLREGKYIPEVYTTSQGLANNTIFGILEDEQGLIWASTGRGISSYNPATNRFANYTKNDGLINDQFYWNASYKSPSDKNMYFGSMGGLTQLKGSGQYTTSGRQKVIFTELQIFNNTIWCDGNNYIDKDISYTGRLELHERDRSFSIKFSALDYDNPSTVLYSYRLLGFDNQWIEVDANRRFISYANLSPGNYRLQVRCMSRSYDWSDDITELKIAVCPYFYKTRWFISLCLIFLTVLAVQLYRWRINSLKKQRQILHIKVEERTRELENQKRLLEEQAIELKLQNNVLFTQNEKISAQRKQLISMSKKVQEAMTDRISFFTNITHEFRTPITLIIGPIERALKLSTNPKVIEQLQFVARNSKHLLSLVNQLMDFRKVESDNVKINLAQGNILACAEEILIPFESFAHERGISIRTVYHVPSPYILFDEDATRKLITNLLSNAIKFTSDGGVITLYISLFVDKRSGEEKLYICVSDTGAGIREEDLQRIFNRFYQSEGHEKYPVYGQSGTGIGLYLCKNIVTLLGGKIYAKNNAGRGASVRILLPVKREDSPEPLRTGNIVIETNTKKDIEKDNSLPYPLQNKQDITILIVEDNADMRKYICSILSDYYRVVEAENGAGALDILRNSTVDFIISDLMMPVMDGFELSQKVKADFSISHIPFLMLTAKTSLETQISSYKIGVDEFLVKPFDDELLLTRVKNMLDARRMYQRKFSLNMNINDLNITEESTDERFLRKAMEVVKANYKNTEYEVGDFIKAMGVSKSLTNSKMQTLTGQSAGNFIRNYRLSIAREMILKSKGNMNISEIAYEVGFNDPKYFTRCFTKHFGIPPSNLNKE